MKDTDKDYCAILLDVFQEHGITDFVVSPGTRNAPILISLSYRINIKCHVATDERTASFMALGMAMISRKPVVLVCTSGTALYNYAPALAEAFYQEIPLLVLSADRPLQWIGQNDSQTLIQPGALEKIVKKSLDIPILIDNDDSRWFVNRVANEAVLLASDTRPGPVHINIQFDSPLSQTKEKDSLDCRIFSVLKGSEGLSPKNIKIIGERMEGKRILVVAGFMPPNDSLNKALLLFSSLPGVKILCETLSNLHLPNNPYAIDSIISGLPSDIKERLRPDIVISIGGALVSGMLKEMIREQKPEVWTLGDTPFSIDCFKNLSLNIKVEPYIFFKTMYHSMKKKYGKIDSDNSYKSSLISYSLMWEEAKKRQISKRNEFVSNIEWSELKAFSIIFKSIKREYNLFLSNGTSVRYAQLFTDSIPHACYSNRGVSGIEGTSATAVGCSMKYKGPTLLITGDMSFAYSPGILGLKDIPKDFRIIVINNRGGGIFRFISPTRYIEHRDRFFCADPKVPIEGLAKAYNWRYLKAENERELITILPEFFNWPSNSILEIFADEEYSAAILRKYMRLNGFDN